MAEITNPHDRFFKELFSQPQLAADFLRYYPPPEIVAVLDVSAPEPVRDGFVDPELRQHFSDLLYRVRLRDGTEAFVYVLFEHKSTPDKWVAFQLLRYLVRIWEMLLPQATNRLPPIYPIVFYHGQPAWTVPVNFRALIEVRADSPLLKHVPEFEYHLVDLATIDDAALRGAPYLRMGLMLFRHIFSDDLKQRLPEIFRLLQEESEQVALDHLRTAVAYLVKAGNNVSGWEIASSLRQAFPETSGGYMATFIQELVQQGRVEGRAEGRAEGEREGRASLTRRQLRKRLGELPDGVDDRIHALGVEQLEQLGEALLDFQTSHDLEAWLREQTSTNGDANRR